LIFTSVVSGTCLIQTTIFTSLLLMEISEKIQKSLFEIPAYIRQV
jgi:hypothetical protein